VLRSLFSGISGLRTHQTLMDVVSNNIANVNTTGFKTSATVFEDTLSQMLRTSGLPTDNLGGLNPAQIGLGVQLAAITTNFRQGSAQTTGKSTDLMVQGDGFFIVDNGVQKAYTRAGAFNFDTNGDLVNAEGMKVQGWMGDGAGTVNTDGQLTDIRVPAGTLIKPTASTTATVAGNITASSTSSTLTLGATVYDDAGVSHPLSIQLVGSTPSFTVTVTDMTTPPGTPGTPSALTFNADGTYASGSASITIGANTYAIDLTGTSNYGGPKSLAVTAVDGSSAGSLQQFQIDQDGTIIGVFSNQQKLALGKIAMANFTNPSGLEKMGMTAFVETSNSGLPQIGIAGSGGRGTLLGSTLEMSNVDLAQEFTNMIIAQRGFQANSRVITTSDQMLQELVDIKR